MKTFNYWRTISLKIGLIMQLPISMDFRSRKQCHKGRKVIMAPIARITRNTSTFAMIMWMYLNGTSTGRKSSLSSLESTWRSESDGPARISMAHIPSSEYLKTSWLNSQGMCTIATSCSTRTTNLCAPSWCSRLPSWIRPSKTPPSGLVWTANQKAGPLARNASTKSSAADQYQK